MTSVSDMEIRLPLVVDLDGTLTLSDTLYESFAKFLFQSPVAALVKDICPHFRGLMPLTPALPGSEPSLDFQRTLITPLRRSGTTFAACAQAESGAAAPDISLGRALPRIGSIAALIL